MPISRYTFLKLSAITALGSGSGLRWFSPSMPKHELIKPKAITENSTIGLIAPGSPIYDSRVFDKMIRNLEMMGYHLKLGKHVRDQRGYLAGTDKDRAADLLSMFDDNGVDAILCIRGGWGCNRILPLIDFDVIKANPKVFAGFSDITSLHMAIQQKAGLVTFHGPVGKSDWNDFTRKAWKKILIDKDTPGFSIPEDQTDGFMINPGKASGKLLGGNLSVLVSMIGSGYLPDFSDSILFLEDVGEDVYRIDRMLTQLKLCGILEQINGLVFGKCTSCEAGSNSLSLKEVFADHLSKSDIPAFYGAMISHEEKNITLPLGVKATIDAGKGIIQLKEPGVV